MIETSIYTELAKDTAVVESLQAATLNIMKKATQLDKFGARTISYFRDDKDAVIYLFDDAPKALTVMVADIHDFNANNTTEHILYWSPLEALTQQIHRPIIVSFCKQKKNNNLDWIPELFQDLDYIPSVGTTVSRIQNALLKLAEKIESVKDDEQQRKPLESATGILSMLVELLQHDTKPEQEVPYELWDFFGFGGVSNLEKSCAHSGHLQEYFHFLKKHDCIEDAHVPSKDYFIELNKIHIIAYQTACMDIAIKMQALKAACQREGFVRGNEFVFNDLDNYVWVADNKLVVASQNILGVCDIADINNFVIYGGVCEYENRNDVEQKVLDKIVNNNIDELNDVALRVINGKIVTAHPYYMYSIALDIQYSVPAMLSDGYKVEEQYPVDIYSYKYLLNYCHARYRLNEFAVLIQVFTTLGGGFDYNEEQGNFVDSATKYIAGLPDAPYSRDTPIKSIRYLSDYTLNRITYLNDEWFDGLQYLIKALSSAENVECLAVDHKYDSVKTAIEAILEKLRKIEKFNIEYRKLDF